MSRYDYPGVGWTIGQWLSLGAVIAAGWFYNVPDGTHEVSQLGGFTMTLSLFIAAAGFLGLGTNLSPWPRPHSTNRLVTHGIYRWIRHPLYLSLIVFSLGWTAWRQSLPAAICLVVLVWVLRRKSAHEENHLIEIHPQYREYQKITGGFFPRWRSPKAPE